MLPVAGSAVAMHIAADSWSALGTTRSWLDEFVWGVPLLVPSLHLCVERWLSAHPDPAANEGALPSGVRPRGDVGDGVALRAGAPRLRLTPVASLLRSERATPRRMS
jgi:hypothetical protein